MTERRCLDCGCPETRRGPDLTNLDPMTGYCVRCLVRRSMGKALPARVRAQHLVHRSKGSSVCQCGPHGVLIEAPYTVSGVEFQDRYCGACGRRWPDPVAS
jgi:hypothetical protein